MFAAVLLRGYGLSSFLHFIRSDFRAYQPDSSISVTSDGFTLYVEEGTTGAADLSCTVMGRTGQLRPITGQTTLSNGHGTFVALASTPPDLPAGRYVISCLSASGTHVQLYLGPRLDLAAVGRLLQHHRPDLLGVSVVPFTILAVLRFRSGRMATTCV